MLVLSKTTLKELASITSRLPKNNSKPNAKIDTTFQDIDELLQEQEHLLVLTKKWKSLSLCMQWAFAKTYIEDKDLCVAEMRHLMVLFRTKAWCNSIVYDHINKRVMRLNFRKDDGTLI